MRRRRAHSVLDRCFFVGCALLCQPPSVACAHTHTPMPSGTYTLLRVISVTIGLLWLQGRSVAAERLVTCIGHASRHAAELSVMSPSSNVCSVFNTHQKMIFCDRSWKISTTNDGARVSGGGFDSGRNRGILTSHLFGPVCSVNA